MVVPLNGSASTSRHGLPVLRLAARSSATLIMQTDQPVLINTHWLGRRLWCSGDDCPGCDLAPCRTVTYFLALVDVPSRQFPVLVETTPHEMSRLAGFCQMDGYVIGSGLVVEASRAKPRSPIRFEPMGCDGTVLQKYQPSTVAVAAAAVLAGLPTPDEDSDLESYAITIQAAAVDRLRRAISES